LPFLAASSDRAMLKRVDPGGRQRQADVGPLVAVGQCDGDSRLISLVVRRIDTARAGRLREPRVDFKAALDPCCPTVVIDRSRTPAWVIIPDWQNGQPRGVQPRKIYTLLALVTVSATGTTGAFGYGQASRSSSVCLTHRRGDAGRLGVTWADAAVGEVRSRRNLGDGHAPVAASDSGGRRARRAAALLPLADDAGLMARTASLAVPMTT